MVADQHLVMDCAEAREALSARMDGEDPGVTAADLERHLSSCNRCRTWDEQARHVTRRAVMRPAPSIPDVSVQVAAALPKRGPTRDRRQLRRLLSRVLLLIVACTQLGLAWWPTSGAGVATATTTHTTREAVAAEVAAAVALLAVAWRPRLAGATATYLSALAAIIATVAAIDLVGGRVSPAQEVPHLTLLLGLLLVYSMAGRQTDSGSRRATSGHGLRASTGEAPELGDRFPS